MKKIKKNSENVVESRNPAGTQPVAAQELSLEKLQMVTGGADSGTWGERPMWASPPPNHSA